MGGYMEERFMNKLAKRYFNLMVIDPFTTERCRYQWL